MKRWLSLILMIAAAMAALTVSASAADADDVEIPDEVTLDNSLVLRKQADDTWTVYDAQKCTGNVVIPSSYLGLPVTAVGGTEANGTYFHAFRDKGSVTGVTIPDTVTNIGPQAFANTGLTTLVIPSSVTNIEDEAFQQCRNLRDVTFLDHKNTTHVLNIGSKAFQFCTSLETVDFPWHTTNIGESAFLACEGLKNLYIWNGTVAANAFDQCLQLEKVAIADKVTSVADNAFGKIPDPLTPADPTNPDPSFDPYPDLPIIHFEGDVKKLAAWPDGKTHLETVMLKAVTPATCDGKGTFNELIRCREQDCALYGSGAVTNNKDLPALGHDIPDLTKAERETKLHDYMADNGLAKCAEFEWTYDKKCTRCSETKTEKEQIAEEFADHQWDPDLSEVVEDVPSTCEENGAGHKTTNEQCEVCGEKKEVTVPNPEAVGHTYTKKNSASFREVEPNCLYYGIEVTYLECDGGHVPEGQMPCAFTTADPKVSKCSELLNAIDAAIDALEKAAKDYTPTNDGAVPDEIPLKTEREALLKAVEDYKAHLNDEHERLDLTKDIPENNKECIVSVNANLEAEGDGHPENAIIPLSEPVRTAPDGKSPYNCVEGGLEKTLSFCPYCGEVFESVKEIAPVRHTVPKDKEKPIDPTCTEPGKIEYLEGAKCDVCGADLSGKTIDNPDVPPLGHDWDDFVPDPGQDTEQAEDCHEKTVTGTAKCRRCGAVTDEMTITIPGKAGHTWSAWVVTKAPSETEPGTETRTCKVCGKTEERTVAATGPQEPDEPDEPGQPDDPGTTPPANDTYTITVVSGVGGTATVSRTTAKQGDVITITVAVDSGFELDMIRVVGAATAEDLGSRRSFTMPASNVEVRVSFERIADAAGWGGVTNGNSKSEPHTQPVVPQQITSPGVPEAVTLEQVFQDIPTTHWASGEIAWVNEMGYMGGTGGKFNPNGIVTNQQLWMVMAKLMGATPVNQTEANRWAFINGFAAGGDPSAAFNRNQLATALYRCAGLKGRDTRNNFTLAGIADSALVPPTNRAAMIWAVSQGIIAADEAGRIQPTKTVTRAELAVFVYRFCQKV